MKEAQIRQTLVPLPCRWADLGTASWKPPVYTHPHIGMRNGHPCTTHKYTHAPKRVNPKKAPAAKPAHRHSNNNDITHWQIHTQCDTSLQPGRHRSHTYGHMHEQTMCKDGAHRPAHGRHREENQSNQHHQQGHPHWHPHQPSKSYIYLPSEGKSRHPQR